jgi:hypothetical protein
MAFATPGGRRGLRARRDVIGLYLLLVVAFATAAPPAPARLSAKQTPTSTPIPPTLAPKLLPRPENDTHARVFETKRSNSWIGLNEAGSSCSAGWQEL